MPLRLSALDAAQRSLFEDASPDADCAVAERGQVPPPVSTPVALPDSIWRHPAASHAIQFGTVHVAYRLNRVRRRSIGFLIGDDGLTVNAPRWVAVGDIESALHEKSAWIVRKLTEQLERQQRQAAARIEWRDGACVPFLGESLRLCLAVTRQGHALRCAERQLTLHLDLPPAAPADKLADVVRRWLRGQARELFEARIRHFEPQLQVRCTRLSLSSAQTRWGMASADGAVRLNWRLIHLSMEAIDYVVVHELAHLREMNHGPRFWGLVESVLPDFQTQRRALRDVVLP